MFNPAGGCPPLTLHLPTPNHTDAFTYIDFASHSAIYAYLMIGMFMSQKNVLKLPQFRIPSSTTGVSYWHPLKRPAADFFSSCRKSRMAMQRTWPEFSATDALAFQILQSPEAQKYSLPKQRFVCLSTTSGSVLQSPVLHLTLITRNPHGGVAILIWKARSWQRCPFPQSLKKNYASNIHSYDIIQ